MRHTNALLAVSVAILLLWPIAAPPAANAQTEQQKPTVQIPEPGVPQIMTMEGRYVRAAYNNEGYVILGYQLANSSVGGPWMLLEIGVTLMQKVPDYKLTREAITLTTPDGTEVPLPTLEEFRNGKTQGLQNQARVIKDSIDYFPPWVSDASRLAFYVDLDHPGKAWDYAELSPVRAALGRLYFNLPGGIQYGQHWLNVKFEKSLVRVPFRILTKEEAKYLDKNYKDISKQVKEAFQPKK
jgi:hypothetical protein